MEKSDVESKYYTPSIEEFHVGFEYEYNDNTIENPIYIQRISSPIDFVIHSYDAYELDEDEILFTRVKYLDKEDIESLGFKQVTEPWMKKRSHCYFKCTIPNILGGEEEYLIYDFNDHRLTIGDITSFEESYNVHNIVIRNKSELKVLLKQLDTC